MSYRPLPCNFAPGSLSDSTVLLLVQTVLMVDNVDAIVYFLGKCGFVSSIVSRTQEIQLPFVAMCVDPARATHFLVTNSCSSDWLWLMAKDHLKPTELQPLADVRVLLVYELDLAR